MGPIKALRRLVAAREMISLDHVRKILKSNRDSLEKYRTTLHNHDPEGITKGAGTGEADPARDDMMVLGDYKEEKHYHPPPPPTPVKNALLGTLIKGGFLLLTGTGIGAAGLAVASGLLSSLFKPDVPSPPPPPPVINVQVPDTPEFKDTDSDSRLNIRSSPPE